MYINIDLHRELLVKYFMHACQIANSSIRHTSVYSNSSMHCSKYCRTYHSEVYSSFSFISLICRGMHKRLRNSFPVRIFFIVNMSYLIQVNENYSISASPFFVLWNTSLCIRTVRGLEDKHWRNNVAFTHRILMTRRNAVTQKWYIIE